MRLGVLGGTFDPVHTGHLDAASAVRDVFSLERVLLVASHMPPHRSVSPAVSAFHRFAMVAMAAMSRDGLEASDLELTRNGPSYTSQTLQRLGHEGHTPSQIFFICGSDAFAEIATWHDYPTLLELAHFVVVSRPGHRPAAGEGPRPALTLTGGSKAGPLPDRPAVLRLEVRTADVSSTGLRDRLARREGVGGLVPPDVERYIDRHGLYRPAGSLHERQERA